MLLRFLSFLPTFKALYLVHLLFLTCLLQDVRFLKLLVLNKAFWQDSLNFLYICWYQNTLPFKSIFVFATMNINGIIYEMSISSMGHKFSSSSIFRHIFKLINCACIVIFFLNKSSYGNLYISSLIC